jgi:uncharacterized protein (UPF0332 family)
MIEKHDRDALIAYRIEQARETIMLAEFLLECNKLTVAVNRIYYGIYYALTALAIKNKFETSKHTQLIGWFNKEYISTSRVDMKYGKILRNSFLNRTKGDYDAYIQFDKNEVENMLIEMKDFISLVEENL